MSTKAIRFILFGALAGVVIAAAGTFIVKSPTGQAMAGAVYGKITKTFGFNDASLAKKRMPAMPEAHQD